MPKISFYIHNVITKSLSKDASDARMSPEHSHLFFPLVRNACMTPSGPLLGQSLGEESLPWNIMWFPYTLTLCVLPDKSPVSTCGGDILSKCLEAILKAPLGVKLYQTWPYFYYSFPGTMSRFSLHKHMTSENEMGRYPWSPSTQTYKPNGFSMHSESCLTLHAIRMHKQLEAFQNIMYGLTLE